jgi:hypothetical protein
MGEREREREKNKFAYLYCFIELDLIVYCEITSLDMLIYNLS